jgi:type II secretory ATPase GspE/PulE/Tfp pilus assembly ATPase PilB-like protein
MIDMIGINPVFSSSVRLVIAQRLLRKLDENKEAYKPDVQTVNYIKQALDNVELTDYNLDDITLWKPKPSRDHPFGYSGRTAVMEQLIVDEPIQKFIRGEMMPDTNLIEATAKRGGMLTLQQKGILAALRGDTTIEEVARVI